MANEEPTNPGIVQQVKDLNAKADPKARQLLVSASDLKPKSKAMTALMERIERLYGSSRTTR